MLGWCGIGHGAGVRGYADRRPGDPQLRRNWRAEDASGNKRSQHDRLPRGPRVSEPSPQRSPPLFSFETWQWHVRRPDRTAAPKAEGQRRPSRPRRRETPGRSWRALPAPRAPGAARAPPQRLELGYK
ncbi:uncharacterized protein LOC144321904 [Canis aureus]